MIGFQGRYLHQDVNALAIVGVDDHAGRARTSPWCAGREYSEDDINTALAAPPNVFMSWDEVGHGTHVMGTAAGDGSQAGNCHLADYFIGVAPEADLVAVKTSWVDSQTMRRRQPRLQRRRSTGDRGRSPRRRGREPVLTGSDGGARNGSTQLEKDIDAALAGNPQGRVIVKSAGNYGRVHDHDQPKPQQFWTGSAYHSRKTIPANSSDETMTAVVIAGDTRDDEFDFWYKGAGRLSITVESPVDADTVGPIAPDGGSQTLPLHGHSILINNRTNVSNPGTHNIYVRISPPAGGQVRAGEWMFTLAETAGTDVDLHCWIGVEKTDAHPRFTNEDQERSFTLTPPGTANRIITVANYDHRDNTLAESSSRGPTTDTRTGFDTKPDIAAPGTGITAAKSGARDDGICCDCCSYDFYTSMSGTSMAAPHITGVIALMLQRNRELTWQEVRDHLRTHADPPDPITAPTLPNTEWGAGIANAEATVGAVPALGASGRSPVVEPPAPRIAAHRAGGDRDFAELRRALLRTPSGQLVFALVSTHLNECIRLVNTDRRVTVAWHRMGGPTFLQAALDPTVDLPTRIPETVDGHDMVDALARLLDALSEAGSLRLRADIAQHRAFVLSLPGRDLTA